MLPSLSPVRKNTFLFSWTIFFSIFAAGCDSSVAGDSSEESSRPLDGVGGDTQPGSGGDAAGGGGAAGGNKSGAGGADGGGGLGGANPGTGGMDGLGGAGEDCALDPLNQWHQLDGPGVDFAEGRDFLSPPMFSSNVVVGTIGELLHALDLSDGLLWTLDTCTGQWSSVDHGWGEHVSSTNYRWERGLFVGTSPSRGEVVTLDLRDGSVNVAPDYLAAAPVPPWDNAPSEGSRDAPFAVGERYTLHFGGSVRTSTEEQDSGQPAALVFGDAQLFDTETESWSSPSLQGAPSPRFDATMVAIGERFFVWAGYAQFVDGATDENSALSDGGIYDPALDTWTSVTSAGAPEQRGLNRTFWTGSEVLVLTGGIGGGLYNPETDRWRTLESYVNDDGIEVYLQGNGDVTENGNYVEFNDYFGPQLLDVSRGIITPLPFDAWPDGSPDEMIDPPAPTNSFFWLIDAWTGTKRVQWGGVVFSQEGCDNLPPDFIGGCDPLYVTTRYAIGGILMIDENF